MCIYTCIYVSIFKSFSFKHFVRKMKKILFFKFEHLIRIIKFIKRACFSKFDQKF